jgi:crotonobetainyl-CoA:carnitine CoA-transferase CaiB-like acyl-CoA transferase
MMALHHRHKTGRGQLIEISQYENVMTYFVEAIMDYSMNQRVHDRIGNRDFHGAAPCGCYHCKGEDRWICITVTSDKEWTGFCQAIGNPAWTQEERFRDRENRSKNQDDLDKLVQEWTSEHDNYEIFHLLQKEGVPAGPVMNPRDVYSDPHVKVRDYFEELTVTDCGTHLYPGQWFKMSKTPLKVRKPPPGFGEDNEYIYKKVISVSDEEYTELEKEGQVGTVPDYYKGR